jgi:hypothetical protein
MDTIELSFLREIGTAWKAEFSADAGITLKLGDTDLVAAVLGAISTDPERDKKLLTDLRLAEIRTLNAFRRNHGAWFVSSGLATVPRRIRKGCCPKTQPEGDYSGIGTPRVFTVAQY